MNTLPIPLLVESVCVIAGILTCWRRDVVRRRAMGRIAALREAAALLSAHADLMDGFLADAEAPTILKDLLLGLSDSMSQRELVLRVTRALALGNAAPASYDDELSQTLEALDDLERSAPALARKFSRAFICGLLGAMLRWPETAALADTVRLKLAVDDARTDVAVAVRETRNWQASAALSFQLKAAAA